MTSFPEDDDVGSVNDDPVHHAAFVAELERIIGPVDESAATHAAPWLLPVNGVGEMLDILRDAPTALGIAGLEDFLRQRLGTLSGMKLRELDPDADV